MLQSIALILQCNTKSYCTNYTIIQAANIANSAQRAMCNDKIKTMKQMTFFDLYAEEKRKPTAAQVFVADVARLTHRSEVTVRMWLSGMQSPDELVQSIIAKKYGVSAASLFPKREKTPAS